MFDAESYQRGFEALDDDFKRGRYYIVPDPSMAAPINGVIRLQQQQQRQDKRNYQRRRGGGGSSDNLLMVDRTPPRRPDDYFDRDGYYNHRQYNSNSSGGGSNNNNSRKSSSYQRFHSSDNLLHAPFHSPHSSDSNPRNHSDFQSSFEYYRGNGTTPSGPSASALPPRQRLVRDTSGYGSSNSPDLRWQNSRRRYNDSDDHYVDYNDYDDDRYDGYDDYRNDSLDTELSDDVIVRDFGIPSRTVRRVMAGERATGSWDFGTQGARNAGGGGMRIDAGYRGSQGRINNSHEMTLRDKPHSSYNNSNSNNNNSNSNNSGGYRDGNGRLIRVERSDSSGTSNMSTKEYWESRWSDNNYSNNNNNNNSNHQQQQQQVHSASPSLREEAGTSRHRSGYLSTDDLTTSRPSGGNRTSAGRSRFISRMVYDGARDSLGGKKNFGNFQQNSSSTLRDGKERGGGGGGGGGGDKEFLSKVQQELELQRRNLTGEIEKLLAPMGAELEKTRSPSIGSPPTLGGVSSPTLNAERSSFVDTSGSTPVFKAFVDVGEYPAGSISVALDQFGNKVVVEARHSDNSRHHVATSFTQRIPLPRYADITSMSAKLNRKGILKVEVPLLFYFPSDYENKSSTSAAANRFGKSFVNKVITDSRDGSKVMEIVVKPGPEVTLNDLRVEVTEGGQLTVYAVTGAKERRVVKTYSLPEAAILDDISSKMAADGTLTVSVPISGAKNR